MGFLVFGSIDGHVRNVDGGLVGLDATGLGAALGLADLHVLGDEVDALDEHLVLLHQDLDDATLLAAVSAALLRRAADDLDDVALLDVRHD